MPRDSLSPDPRRRSGHGAGIDILVVIEEPVGRIADEFAAAHGGDAYRVQNISKELTELLAAYRQPPEQPRFHGDVIDYAGAVNQYSRLMATPHYQA